MYPLYQLNVQWILTLSKACVCACRYLVVDNLKLWIWVTYYEQQPVCCISLISTIKFWPNHFFTNQTLQNYAGALFENCIVVNHPVPWKPCNIIQIFPKWLTKDNIASSSLFVASVSYAVTWVHLPLILIDSVGKSPENHKQECRSAGNAERSTCN